MSPKISVVIPNFNDDRIERTINSIKNQIFKEFELIIVEGCLKNDKTKPIYEKYKDRIDVLIHELDEGIFDALNKGIEKTSGDLIYLIGSDDRLSDNECFSSVINKFNANPNSDGICIGCQFVTSKNKTIRKWKINNISSSKIKWGIMPPHLSLFLKKELYNEIGYFDFKENYIASDTEWLLRLASKKQLSIPNVKNHFVVMEYGGESTGSLKYILKAIITIGKAAKKNEIKQWFLTPFIKLFSKIFQIQSITSIRYLKN